MNANFSACLAAVLKHEGGYADHPADPGGATKYGITLATLAASRGRPVTKAMVQALTVEEAGAIYRARYWNAVRGDDIPTGLDLALFDFAVNSGPRRAILALQGILGVVADGRIGAQTLSAIAARPARDLASALCARRLAFLRGLGTFPAFGRGWTRRVHEIEAQAERMTGTGAPVEERGRRTQTGTASAGNPGKKEPSHMDMTKSILTSRTVWANAVGLVALALSWFGFDTSSVDKNAIIEQAFQAVAALSFIGSTFFRVIASKKLI